MSLSPLGAGCSMMPTISAMSLGGTGTVSNGIGSYGNAEHGGNTVSRLPF
jgi:hypothetical protein